MRSETMIKHPSLLVVRRTGTEGPRHDPYAWTELQVENKSGTHTLHEGFVTWYEGADGVRHDQRNWTEDDLMRMFERDAGFSISQIERIARKLHSRCAHCGSHDFTSEEGYPGESFDVCCNCGHVQNCSMDYSAIE